MNDREPVATAPITDEAAPALVSLASAGNIAAADSNAAEPEAPASTEVGTGLDDRPGASIDISPVEMAKPNEPDLSVVRLIEKADHSAGKLVNLLAKHFPSFRDEARFDGRKVRFLKRAQIFVADIWAAFNGTGYGSFDDIGHLTMFAGKFSRVCDCNVLRAKTLVDCFRLQSAANVTFAWRTGV